MLFNLFPVLQLTPLKILGRTNKKHLEKYFRVKETRTFSIQEVTLRYLFFKRFRKFLCICLTPISYNIF